MYSRQRQPLLLSVSGTNFAEFTHADLHFPPPRGFNKMARILDSSFKIKHKSIKMGPENNSVGDDTDDHGSHHHHVM